MSRKPRVIGQRSVAVATCHSCQQWTAVLLLNLSAGTLDNFSVLHAGWARSFARSAVEAKVEMAPDLLVQRDTPVGDGPHEINTAAWAIVLIAQLDVSGARGGAKTAMNAIQKEFIVDAGALVRNRRQRGSRKR